MQWRKPTALALKLRNRCKKKPDELSGGVRNIGRTCSVVGAIAGGAEPVGHLLAVPLGGVLHEGRECLPVHLCTESETLRSVVG